MELTPFYSTKVFSTLSKSTVFKHTFTLWLCQKIDHVWCTMAEGWQDLSLSFCVADTLKSCFTCGISYHKCSLFFKKVCVQLYFIAFQDTGILLAQQQNTTMTCLFGSCAPALLLPLMLCSLLHNGLTTISKEPQEKGFPKGPRECCC